MSVGGQGGVASVYLIMKYKKQKEDEGKKETLADILKNDGVKNVIIIVEEVEVGGVAVGGQQRNRSWGRDI